MRAAVSIFDFCIIVCTAGNCEQCLFSGEGCIVSN